MARRKRSGEVNIGSDSFLDVLANIVGVLIILIVVAGIRASQEPVDLKKIAERPDSTAPLATSIESPVEAPPVSDSAAPETETSQPDPPPSVAESPPPEPAPSPAEDPELEEPEEPRFAEAMEPPPDLAQRMQNLKDEIESLETISSATQAELKELEAQQARGELQIATGKNLLVQEKEKLDTTAKSVEQLQALMASQQASLQLLRSQLEEQKQRGPKTKSLKHKVTPISRAVATEQIHVRISQNKVSIVPIRPLLEAAMRQAKKHAAELASGRSRYGTAGPISGYTLEYRLAAEPASVAEQSRGGPGLFRISLTSFKLEPEPELREEPIEQALQRGSAFDIAMQTAERNTTFTLWVYPESFSSYRALQTRLHELGFTVAGRPLPLGIPISGSPDGTASAGQ